MTKIVINMPDFLYKQILKKHVSKALIARIFQNGVVLPKGHGRLIDANKFEVVMLQGKTDEFVEGVKWVLEQLDKTDTIIEADK